MIRLNAADTNNLRVKFVNDFNTYNVSSKEFSELDRKYIDEISYLTFDLEFYDIDLLSDTIMGGLGMPVNPLLSKLEQGGGIQQDSYPNTALSYLKARGLNEQHDSLKSFIENLAYISYDKPWFFQKVTGLKDVWKAGNNANKTYKGKDLKITIDTLESLDLSITHIADLYRKSIYDTYYMREIVPVNLRYFPMNIYVGEFRNLHSINSNGSIDTSYSFFGEMIYYKFSCFMCEFDFNESAAFDDTINIGRTIDQAKSKFDIKIGMVFEQHRYGKNDAITIDDFNKYAGVVSSQNNTRMLKLQYDKEHTAVNR